VENLYNENCKTLKKEIKEDTKRWKDLLCSWIGRINTMKMAMLPKAIYRLNTMPIKIPMSLCRNRKINLKFIWKNKDCEYQKQS
jgi:hypothetical protein